MYDNLRNEASPTINYIFLTLKSLFLENYWTYNEKLSTIKLVSFNSIIHIYVSQFWINFQEIHTVGAVPHMSETYCFWKQSAQQNYWYEGKCAHKTAFSVFIPPVWVFLRKNNKKSFRYLISQRKGYIHFCHLTLQSLINGHVPQKLFFRVILENSFFRKNC